MIVLLNFFRKKITKIYMLIFALIILIIFTINSLVNYFNKAKQEIFAENSYILIYSSQNYLEELESYKHISNIEECLFGNINSKLIKAGDKIVFDEKGNVINENKSDDPNAISLDDLIISGYEKSIIVEDTNGIYKLKRNEIIFGITAEIFASKKESITNLKNQKINFTINDNKYEFIVKDFYIENFPFMTISPETFSKITKNNVNYLYRAKADSYENAYEAKRQLEKGDRVIKVSVESSYDEKDITNMEKIDYFLSTFQIIEKVSIVFTCIISYLLLINIKKDYFNDFKILYNIGFAKTKINIIFIGTLLLQFLISTIIGYIFSLGLTFMINRLFELSLNYVNYELAIKAFAAIIILIVIMQTINKSEYYSQ